MAKAIIWAKTAYRTGKCQSCGYKVREQTGEPTGDTLVDVEKGYFFCPTCGQIVAREKDFALSREELVEIQKQTGGKLPDEMR